MQPPRERRLPPPAARWIVGSSALAALAVAATGVAVPLLLVERIATAPHGAGGGLAVGRWLLGSLEVAALASALGVALGATGAVGLSTVEDSTRRVLRGVYAWAAAMPPLVAAYAAIGWAGPALAEAMPRGGAPPFVATGLALGVLSAPAAALAVERVLALGERGGRETVLALGGPPSAAVSLVTLPLLVVRLTPVALAALLRALADTAVVSWALGSFARPRAGDTLTSAALDGGLLGGMAVPALLLWGLAQLGALLVRGLWARGQA